MTTTKKKKGRRSGRSATSDLGIPPASFGENRLRKEELNESSSAAALATSISPNYDASIDFLRKWAPEGPWVLTAIEPDNRKISTRTFSHECEPALMDWLKEHGQKCNLYFMPNPPLRDLTKKATREDIAEVVCLHVDVDPRAGEDIKSERERILQLLNQPEKLPVPTLIVDSGGGYQAYWKLDYPLPIGGDVNKAENAKLFNLEIELKLGADSCHDICRIMRLPGTVNRPDKKKLRKGRKEALAQVIEWDDGRTYSIKQFKQSPMAQAVAERNAVQISDIIKRLSSVNELPAKVSDRCKVVIVQGYDPDEPKKHSSRSEWLFFVCCELVRADVDNETIYSIITDPNFGISASVLDKGSSSEKYACRQIERARENAIHPELAELNERHFVVGNWGGRCRVAEEVWDDALKRSRLTKQSFEDFRNRYMHQNIEVGTNAQGNPIYKMLGHWWLQNSKRRTYQRIVFAPGDTVEPDTYNLWQGFGCEPRAGACELFLDHIRENICCGNSEIHEYLLSWMASTVQRPAEPGQVAIVLRGRQGTGKSFFAKAFGSLFGRHYMRVSDAKHLIGSFNAHLRDVILLFADEAFYAGDKRSRGLLKSIITDETLTIEPKGVDAELSRNCISLIMASNEKWVVPAEFDDRRFLVLDVADTKARNVEYFRAISEQMTNGGNEALLHYLLERDLDGFEIRDRPETTGLQDQKVLSLEPETEWLLILLEEGALPNSPQGKPHVAYSNDDDLNNRLGLFTHARRSVPKLRDASERRLGGALSEWGAARWKEGRRGWIFPPLSELREKWDTRYGPHEWSGGREAQWRPIHDFQESESEAF